MLNGNSAAWRLSEDKPFLEAFGQEAARVLIYGDKATEPAAYHGLAPRYKVVPGSTKGTVAYQVEYYDPTDAGSKDGTPGANTSAWFHTWGEQASHLTFPKGTKAGIVTEDLGQVTADDGDGGFFEALRTHFEWNLGFVLRDFRYTSRVVNIDTTSLTAPASTAARVTLIQSLIRGYNKCKKMSGGRRALYVSQQVKTALDLAVNEKVNVNLTMQDYAGQPTMHFYEVPIRVCDSILDTEGDETS